MKHAFTTFFALVLAGFFFAAPAAAQKTLAIAAVVNDEAISMTDVEERMRMVLASSGLPDSPEMRKRIQPQVVDSLIEEQLKLQEAARNKLEVSEEEVAEGLKTIAQQNNFTPEQFMQVMQKQGIPSKTLLRQIRAQLAWNKVVKDVLRRQVDVSQVDVTARIERLKNRIGQTEYLVAEIFLPLDNPEQNAQKQQFAQRLSSELQAKKAPFGAVAAQFSKAAGAEKGGMIGWVQQGTLEPELDKAILSMEEGGVSNPIKTNSGLYILHLAKKRTITEESLPSREELTNTIGFERLDRVQQRALLDLKTAAFIDRRV